MRTLSTLFFALLIGGSAMAQPVANFSTTGADPTYAFTNTTTGFFDYQYWDFGDGTYGYSINETHTYANNGLYLVCLTVIDSAGGFTSTHCDSVVVSNAAGGGSTSCNASFTTTISGNTVSFANNSSGTGLNHYWNFGDGSTSSVANPTYTYSTAGTYSVCLTVWDNGTPVCADTLCTTVTTSGSGGSVNCQASFFWYQDTAFSNTLILVNTSSSASGSLTYAWDFGDGNTATGAYPTHTYASPGLYLVCVTINDGMGCTSTFCDSVYAVIRANGLTLNVIAPSQVGITETELTKVNAYPNPVSDLLTLELSAPVEATVQVYGISGELVASEAINGSRSTLNVSALAEGLYVARLTTANGQVLNTFRFVVKK
jgi:PKD repeat protein